MAPLTAFRGWHLGLSGGFMAAWISAGRGIRYREHKSRKHGQRLDRYWCIRYKLDGLSLTEAVGWWSEGASQARCEEILGVLRQNQRTGDGPQTWAAMRTAAQEKLAAEEAAQEADKAEGMTVAEFWPQRLARLGLTATPECIRTSRVYMRLWMAGLADMPLADITTDDLERLVVRPMVEAGKSPSTIDGVLGTFSAMWSDAWRQGLISGTNPKTKVRKPKTDNKRERFLTHAEAARLLEALWRRSVVTHDMALLSMFSGLRAGECRRLTWADIDLEHGQIFVKNTKNKFNRHAHITTEIREMLLRRYEGQSKSTKVLLGLEGGESYCTIQGHFRRAIKELGLNQGITDRRQKVCFHTLRHTFASWLVIMGKPLYTVSKLLGHRNIRWTERYAHLAPEAKKAAVEKLEGILNHANEALLLANEGL